MEEPLPPTEPPISTDQLPSEIALVLLTVEEATQRLSIGRTTMYALLKDGHINSVRDLPKVLRTGRRHRKPHRRQDARRAGSLVDMTMTTSSRQRPKTQHPRRHEELSGRSPQYGRQNPPTILPLP